LESAITQLHYHFQALLSLSNSLHGAINTVRKILASLWEIKYQDLSSGRSKTHMPSHIQKVKGDTKELWLMRATHTSRRKNLQASFMTNIMIKHFV
jgi:hypothetical protein